MGGEWQACDARRGGGGVRCVLLRCDIRRARASARSLGGLSASYLGGYLGAVSQRGLSARSLGGYLGGISQARADSLAAENAKLTEAIAAEDAEMGRMKSELKRSLMWTRARAKSMAEKAKIMLGARS